MKHMSDELKKFSSHIKSALDNYQHHRIDKNTLNNIIICGMGGSGIAGRIVKDYFRDKIDLPVEMVAEETLPRYAGKGSLAIFCSYSGNTEETLSAYDIAREKGCRILVITSGGRLMEKALEDEFPVYRAEAGLQPRSALGFLLTYHFLILFELLGIEKKADLAKIAGAVSNTDDYLMSSAELLDKFRDTLKRKFIIVCDPYFEGAALRFSQVLNENAKLEAFVHVLPEAGHNAIESYGANPGSNFLFINSRRSHRVNLRFSYFRELLEQEGLPVVDKLVADASLNSLYHLIHQLDWLSLQIAGELDRRSDRVPHVEGLKEFLSKHTGK